MLYINVVFSFCILMLPYHNYYNLNNVNVNVMFLLL